MFLFGHSPLQALTRGCTSYLSLSRSLQETIDPRTRCQRGLFSVSQPNDDIYLVLRVDKVLQGDSTAIELYTKTDLVRHHSPSRLLPRLHANAHTQRGRMNGTALEREGD